MHFLLSLARISRRRSSSPNSVAPNSVARRLARALFIGAVLTIFAAAAGCTPNLGASTDGWGAVAVNNDVVYAVTLDGQVFALNDLGSDGVSSRWVSAIAGENGFQGSYNSPAVARYVYVAGIDGFLYAIDGSSGGGPAGIVWRRPQVDAEEMTPLVGSPALDEAGGIVAVGSEDGGLYAYNAFTGEGLHWSPFMTEGEIWSTPLLRNGVAYFGSQDGNVYAVSLQNGELLWQYETGAAVVSTPMIHKDLLIVGSFDRYLYGLGLRDGQMRWQFAASNWWWATPVASGRAIFAPAMDGTVYALSESGELLWQHDVGAPVVSSPVLLERGMVVAAVDGTMSVLRATEIPHGDAQEIASLKLGNAEIKARLISPPDRIEQGLPVPADSVYVGSDDGKVRRVQVRSGINIMWCYDTRNNTGCN